MVLNMTNDDCVMLSIIIPVGRSVLASCLIITLANIYVTIFHMLNLLFIRTFYLFSFSIVYVQSLDDACRYNVYLETCNGKKYAFAEVCDELLVAILIEIGMFLIEISFLIDQLGNI